MKIIPYIGWLAGQAADGLTYLWPVSLILLLLACAAVLSDIRRKRLQLDRRFPILLLPVTSVVAILIVGGAFQERSAFSYLPNVGLGAGIVMSIVSGRVLRRAWMSSVSVSLCCLWYAFWCGFVATMSITGNWL